MTKHTEGKWINDTTQRVYSGRIIRMNGVQICRMIDQTTTPTEEVEANAALIAAAPDLLSACEAALAAIEYEQETNNTLICAGMDNTLRTAIQKAKGEIK